jgi:hypothetical protein
MVLPDVPQLSANVITEAPNQNAGAVAVVRPAITGFR